MTVDLCSRVDKIVIVTTEKGNEELTRTRQWWKEEREVLEGISLHN